MIKIAIIDDDKYLAEAYRAILENDFEVLLIQDSHSSLEQLLEFRPNLIILDQMMPGADGLSLLEIIKNEHELKNIQVILASNYDGEELIQKAYELGAKKVFCKADYAMADVVAMVKSLLAI